MVDDEGEAEELPFETPDGVRGTCRVGRLALPDGRTAFVVEELGRRGRGTPSVVEHLATALCRRYGVPPDQAVWVRRYRPLDDDQPPWYERVTFRLASDGFFYDPQWTLMKDKHWQDLGLPPPRGGGDDPARPA